MLLLYQIPLVVRILQSCCRLSSRFAANSRAQQGEWTRRVTVLVGLDEQELSEAQKRVKAFRAGMRDLGWIEGRNIQIEYRFAGGNL